jgi:hypothetical protein
MKDNYLTHNDNIVKKKVPVKRKLLILHGFKKDCIKLPNM